MKRRTFIRNILLSIFSFEIIFLIFAGISRYGNSKKNTSNLFNAGALSTFKKGESYLFLSGAFSLRRFNDGGFLSISLKCTHLGCMVKSNKHEGNFICPCHSSKFDKNGEIISSPATRPLDIFKVIIKNNQVFVDNNKPIKRIKFEKSQLTYS